ncbi:MAG: hypothetical protein FWG25_01725 [Promicromonosporaceae bacterium]|nr:hypothetical protein [Promicromonosporaceae bacterium]
MKGPYYLIGAPHCGKSTLGRRAAEILALPFHDTDDIAFQEIRAQGANNPLSWRTQELFRNAQVDAVQRLSKLREPTIVSTGAEVALMPKCIKAMKETGIVIQIKRDVQVILGELGSTITSPTVLIDLGSGDVLDLRQKTVLGYSDQLDNYEAVADLTVLNDGSETEGVERLCSIIAGAAVPDVGRPRMAE